MKYDQERFATNWGFLQDLISNMFFIILIFRKFKAFVVFIVNFTESAYCIHPPTKRL